MMLTLNTIESIDNRILFNRCGSLFQGRSGYNGYSILKLDLNSNIVDVIIRQYYNERKCFDKNININTEGKGSFKLKNGSLLILDPEIELIEDINKKIKNHINKTLLTALSNSIAPKDLNLIFVDPPLSTVSEYKYEAVTTIPDNKRVLDFTSLREIIDKENNVVFVGNKETGKTTLLNHICLTSLETDRFSSIKIPFLIDFDQLPKGINPFHKAMNNFILEFRKKFDIENNLAEGKCLLLIDNFDFTNKKKVNSFREFVKKYPKNRYILTTSENLLNHINKEDEVDICIEYEKIYMHSFKRKHVRSLANKWFYNTEADIENIIDKIIVHIISINVPCTPMTISLFLWIFEKQENFIPINKASLIEKFIEYSLEKLNIEEVKSEEMDYRNKEDFLMHIATKMVKRNEYFFNIQDFEEETLKYFKKRGLKTSIVPFIQDLIDKGIFVQLDGVLYFRFKCFCEFFIAKAMIEDTDFYNEIIEENKYLSFVSEIDILSGLQRKNRELLTLIGERVKKAFIRIDNHFGLDINLFKNIELNKSIIGSLDKETTLEELRDSKLSDEERDDLLDPNYRYPKKQNMIKKEYSDFEKMAFSNLILFSKLIKNCELIDDVEFKRKNVRNCMIYYAKTILLCLIVLEKIFEEIEERRDDELDYMSKVFIPIALQGLIHSELGTKKLEVIIKEEMRNADNDIFIRVMFTLLYADLKLPNYIKEIKILTKSINTQYLKEIIFYKLIIFYLLSKLSDQERSEIEIIISEIFLNTHSTGNRQKDYSNRNNFLANLKKRRSRTSSNQKKLF